MTITHPHSDLLPQLRQLWKDVFSDSDAFLDRFFTLAYGEERCLCALEAGTVTGMLYWLPCGNYAYVYAVATHPEHRGKGICRGLMLEAHRRMAGQGFRGVLLYPQEEGLRAMYRKLGYTQETFLSQRRFRAGGAPAELTKISPADYFALRAGLLPPEGVIQESPFRELMEHLTFYSGGSFLLAAEDRGDDLFVPELLGDPGRAPGILSALGKQTGVFRFPGRDIPFAMFHSLTENGAAPSYFAFPLD